MGPQHTTVRSATSRGSAHPEPCAFGDASRIVVHLKRHYAANLRLAEDHDDSRVGVSVEVTGPAAVLSGDLLAAGVAVRGTVGAEGDLLFVGVHYRGHKKRIRCNGLIGANELHVPEFACRNLVA